ncbi:TIGR00730 family Rossman fold protein [Hoeflea sp. AS60]|uniref:LOG family protein n=1 Tax=Hoeflea sp. AS60 TaxID=3135780 RepID=UPI0031767E50
MSTQQTRIGSICVYCGSQPGHEPAYREAAEILGRSMAENGIDLVYGGGTKGLMGAVADAVMSNGGKAVGIIPEFLMDKEASRQELGQLTELHVTKDMHERKHMMFERSDAFVTLPGGIGTLEEIIEIMTWAQLGRHTKPMVFANINGFWDPLNALIGHMSSQGFIHTAHLVQPLVIDRAEDIVPAILAQSKNLGSDGDAAVLEKM